MAKNKIIRNVLISRFSALGDVAMTIPVIYSVCSSNPEIRFVVITKPNAAPLFVNAPENLIVRGVDLKKYSGLIGLWRLFRELKEEFCFDTFVDLHDVLRTKILRIYSRFRGVSVRHIDKGRGEKKALTRRHNKILLPLTSSIDRYKDVFRRFDLFKGDSFSGLFGKQRAVPEVFSEFIASKQQGEKWVAVAPFAMHQGKIYPPELMLQVVKDFAGRDNYKIFLFGAGRQESEILADWQKLNAEKIVNMAELKKGIPVELALLSHCDVMISMDSANMHMASLVNIPVVSIWGATHPYCGFYGWKQNKENAIQLDMTCRPCSVFGNKPCVRKDYHCLYGIQPTSIISQVDSLIRELL